MIPEHDPRSTSDHVILPERGRPFRCRRAAVAADRPVGTSGLSGFVDTGYLPGLTNSLSTKTGQVQEGLGEGWKRRNPPI